jgi:hypothetical protein
VYSLIVARSIIIVAMGAEVLAEFRPARRAPEARAVDRGGGVVSA